jgi:hypothetical protein
MRGKIVLSSEVMPSVTALFGSILPLPPREIPGYAPVGENGKY